MTNDDIELAEWTMINNYMTDLDRSRTCEMYGHYVRCGTCVDCGETAANVDTLACSNQHQLSSCN